MFGSGNERLDGHRPHLLQHLLRWSPSFTFTPSLLKSFQSLVFFCNFIIFTCFLGLEGLMNLLPVYMDHILNPILSPSSFHTEVHLISPRFTSFPLFSDSSLSHFPLSSPLSAFPFFQACALFCLAPLFSLLVSSLFHLFPRYYLYSSSRWRRRCRLRGDASARESRLDPSRSQGPTDALPRALRLSVTPSFPLLSILFLLLFHLFHILSIFRFP